MMKFFYPFLLIVLTLTEKSRVTASSLGVGTECRQCVRSVRVAGTGASQLGSSAAPGFSPESRMPSEDLSLTDTEVGLGRKNFAPSHDPKSNENPTSLQQTQRWLPRDLRLPKGLENDGGLPSAKFNKRHSVALHGLTASKRLRDDDKTAKAKNFLKMFKSIYAPKRSLFQPKEDA